MTHRLLALGIAALGCGGAPSTPTAPPPPSPRSAPVLRLDATSAPIRVWLESIAERLPPGECGFAWGDLGNVPTDAPRARVSWSAGELNGVVLCGPALEAQLQDPRIHQVALTEWDGAQLWASHPSGPGRTELSLPTESDASRDLELFALASCEANVNAERCWPALAPLPHVVRFAVMVLR